MAIVYRKRPKRIICSRCSKLRAPGQKYCRYHLKIVQSEYRKRNSPKVLRARIEKLEAELAEARNYISTLIGAT